MSLESDLQAVRDYLRSRLDLDVAVSRPNDAVPGLYVWPWRMVPKPESRNLPTHLASGAGLLSLRVHCLLLITPADIPGTISKLDLAARAIQEQPILEHSSGSLRLTLETIEPQNLAALFLAARLQLTLSLPFTLESYRDA